MVPENIRGYIVMPKTVEIVDSMKRNRMHRIVYAVAKIIGRVTAQEIATDVYNVSPEAQQLTLYEMLLLDRTGNRNTHGR